MAKFKKGDKVRLLETSQYYGNPWDTSNPMDIEGIINILTSNPLGIKVIWANNRTNSYSESDLELLTPKQPKTGNETYTIKQIEEALFEYDKSDREEIIEAINNS